MRNWTEKVCKNCGDLGNWPWIWNNFEQNWLRKWTEKVCKNCVKKGRKIYRKKVDRRLGYQKACSWKGGWMVKAILRIAYSNQKLRYYNTKKYWITSSTAKSFLPLIFVRSASLEKMFASPKVCRIGLRSWLDSILNLGILTKVRARVWSSRFFRAESSANKANST